VHVVTHRTEAVETREPAAAYERDVARTALRGVLRNHWSRAEIAADAIEHGEHA
jgi:hypothetical protein